MRSFEFLSQSEEQTEAFAAQFAKRLQPRDVIALEGQLGAGKTCFVRGLAHGLHVEAGSVSSPTFVISQEYPGRLAGLPVSLVHVDAYRLGGPDDLETIGWQELTESEATILAVEWPSRIAAALPADRIDVSLSHEGHHSRLIRVAAPAAIADRLRLKALGEKPGARFACRSCSKPINDDIQTFPFCSPRCRLADLGQWFNEGFRMTRPVEVDEELED